MCKPCHTRVISVLQTILLSSSLLNSHNFLNDGNTPIFYHNFIQADLWGKIYSRFWTERKKKLEASLVLMKPLQSMCNYVNLCTDKCVGFHTTSQCRRNKTEVFQVISSIWSVCAKEREREWRREKYRWKWQTEREVEKETHTPSNHCFWFSGSSFCSSFRCRAKEADKI